MKLLLSLNIDVCLTAGSDGGAVTSLQFSDALCKRLTWSMACCLSLPSSIVTTDWLRTLNDISEWNSRFETAFNTPRKWQKIKQLSGTESLAATKERYASHTCAVRVLGLTFAARFASLCSHDRRFSRSDAFESNVDETQCKSIQHRLPTRQHNT